MGNFKGKEIIELCFKHPSCRTCPRNAKCEREIKEGDTIERVNTKTRKVHTKHSQWYEPETSIQRRI